MDQIINKIKISGEGVRKMGKMLPNPYPIKV